MPQSKVITDDGSERLGFKDRLNDKLGGLLTLPAAVVPEPRVLLLPEGHDGMDEAELLFVLTHNAELAHSRDSAVMAVNLLKGRAAKPPHVTFQVVELADPVPVPEFVAEIPARRKSSGVAPGFSRLKDSAPEREDKEALKKAQFKQSLADSIDRKLAEVPTIEKVETRVLLLPEGHERMIDAELQFTLANNPELMHTTESAALAVNILQGRAAKPPHLTFEVVELVDPVPVPAFAPVRRKFSSAAPRIKDSAPEREDKEALKKAQFKQSLADSIDRKLAEVPTIEKVETRVLLVPSNYEGLAEAELLFTLANNPELRHTPESAVLTAKLLQGRAAKPANVSFDVVTLENPVPVPEFVAEIPARRKSSGVAPGFSRLKDSAPEREDKEALKKAQFKQSLADSIDRKLAEVPTIEKVETRVLLVPSNYEELADADLHFALVNNPDLKHSHDSALLAIDMINGLVRPTDTVLQTVASATGVAEQPKRAPQTTATEARAQDVTTLPQESGGEVMLLPANYRELAEGVLGFVLTHTPELQHTPEEARFILDVLFGRAEASGVEFQVVAPVSV